MSRARNAAIAYMTLLRQRGGVSITVVSNPTVNVAPVIGATPDVTPAVWSSGASDTQRWEMADSDAGPWSTVSDMPNIDTPYTDQTFGKVLRWVEAQGSVTAESAATTPVGITGLTHAWSLEEPSGIRRNVLADADHLYDNSVGQANGHAEFVAADLTYLLAADSAALSFGADTAFTISFMVKPSSIAGTTWLLTKHIGPISYTNALFEFTVYQSAGAVSFRLGNGTTFQTVTVAAALSAGVTARITIAHNPAADILSLKINNGTPVTAAWSGGTLAGDGPILVGGLMGTSNFSGEIWNLLFYNGTYLDATAQAALYSAPPTFPTAAFYGDTEIDPDDLDVSVRYSRHDFSDTALLWQDAAMTTPVASNDDPIRVIEDAWNDHDWTAASDAARPLWKSAAQNSLGVGDWDGATSQLDFDEVWPSGDFAAFIVVKNDDMTLGSHVLAPGDYLALTGTDYDADPRAVMHFENSSAFKATLPNPTGWNIVEIARTGTSYVIRSNGRNPAVATNVSGFNPDHIGNALPAVGATWWMDGQVAEVVRLSDDMSDTVRARIRFFLREKWGVAGVA